MRKNLGKLVVEHSYNVWKDGDYFVVTTILGKKIKDKSMAELVAKVSMIEDRGATAHHFTQPFKVSTAILGG